MRYLSLSLVFLTTSLFSQTEEGDTPKALIVDPGNDAFVRAQSVYLNGTKNKNARERRKMLSNAISQLHKYVKAFPQHKNTEAAVYYLGASYYQVGNLPQARKYFNQVIDTYKTGENVAESANYLAYDAESKKNYKSAVQYYNIVATSSKEQLYIEKGYFRQGVCYEALKDSKNALLAYKRLIAATTLKSVIHQRGQLASGHLYYKAKNYKQAELFYAAVAKQGVNDIIRGEATYFKGLCLERLKEYQKAEEVYKEVLTLADAKWKPHASVSIMSNKLSAGKFQDVIDVHLTPDLEFKGKLADKRHLYAGQAYLKLGKAPDAIEEFNKIIKKNKNTMEEFEARYRKILCYYNLESHLVTGQVNQFIRRYGRQFSQHKFMHAALMLQAETLFDSKSYESAAKVYKQIKLNLISEVNRPSVLYKKAWSLAESGKDREAIKFFTEFLTTYPEDKRKAQILGVRAKSYLKIDDTKSATKDYNALIKIEEKTKLAGVAYQATARILKEEKKYLEMVKRYESLLEIEGLDMHVKLNAHYWIAWGYFKEKEHRKAVPHIKAAQKIDKGVYRKQLSLLSVLCYFNLKNKDECSKAAKDASLVGIANDIPMGIYRWLGVQCYKAGEYPDAQSFLTLGVTKINPNNTPVYYWRLLAKCQYENKHYKWALQSLTHALNMETDPAHKVNLLLYKALCQNGENKPELAKSTAIAALKQNPSGRTKALLLKLVGDVSYKAQNYKDAAINYASITEFYDDKEVLPYAYAMIVKAMKASGRESDAQAFKKVLDSKFPQYQLPD